MRDEIGRDYALEPVHINFVRPCDTVFHGGALRTVCASDIRRCSFMGASIFGDTYALGHTPVQRVVFKRV